MKIVRKFTPVSLYDIPGLEQWFEEMGREGLFPLRTKEWTTFRDDGKPGTRFRLEPTTALCSFYAEAGGLMLGYEG